MFTIDLLFSLTSLFNLSPDQSCVTVGKYLEKLTPEQRRYFDYHVKLLQNNRWDQYYCSISGFTLHCVKTGFNQHLQDNVPYRLFFLSERSQSAPSRRILLLSNLRIAENEHTTQDHMKAIQVLLNGIQTRHQMTPQVCSLSSPSLPLYQSQAPSTESIDTEKKGAGRATSSNSNSDDQVQSLQREFSKNNFTRKNITRMIDLQIANFNALRQLKLIARAIYTQLNLRGLLVVQHHVKSLFVAKISNMKWIPNSIAFYMSFSHKQI